MPQAANIETLLGQIFDEMQEGRESELSPEQYAERRADFIFHMTDWKEDFTRLSDLFANPARYSKSDAAKRLASILYHIVPHLNAAGRLLLDEIVDPFAAPNTKECQQEQTR